LGKSVLVPVIPKGLMPTGSFVVAIF